MKIWMYIPYMKIELSIFHLWKYGWIYSYIYIEFSTFHIWKHGCIFPYMKIEFSRFPVRKYRCIFPYVKIDFLYFLFENKISYISCMKIWMHISIHENLIFYISCRKIWVQILGLALLIIFFLAFGDGHCGCCHCPLPKQRRGIPFLPAAILHLLFVDFWWWPFWLVGIESLLSFFFLIVIFDCHSWGNYRCWPSSVVEIWGFGFFPSQIVGGKLTCGKRLLESWLCLGFILATPAPGHFLRIAVMNSPRAFWIGGASERQRSGWSYGMFPQGGSRFSRPPLDPPIRRA